MRIAVVGSREYGRLDQVTFFLDHMLKLNPAITIVSGGADGVDKAAEEWAKAHNIECKVFPADWENDGDKAGIKRNALIIENSDSALVFWDGESAGTLDSLCRGMKKKNYPVKVLLG
jgi:hypothetical protein